MNGFPSTASEFYALRDDRTDKCIANQDYQQTTCAVYLSGASAVSLSGQTMLAVATNLLSRWCRRVMIVVPAVAADSNLGLGSGDLGERVLAQMLDADPFGHFSLSRGEAAPADIALCIGELPAGSNWGRAVYVDAADWLASLSLQDIISLRATPNSNSLGAVAAACLGVAQLFKIATRMLDESLLRDGIFDLFQLEWVNKPPDDNRWPASLQVGDVLMVGAGSVGSAAAYCMRLGGLSGNMTIVDKDTVKVENFNRSPIFGRQTFGLAKVDSIVSFLQGSSLNAIGVPSWWNEFLKQRDRKALNFDVWLPLANEFGARHSIQHNVPPLMIHASTSADWGVNFGRHIPGRDDCLIDRFPVAVKADDLVCATGQVAIEGTVIDAALPFASMFAGLLIAGDLVRAQLPGYPQVYNYAKFDWKGRLDYIQKWDYVAGEDCLCRDQGLVFHDAFNGTTKYRPLFQL